MKKLIITHLLITLINMNYFKSQTLNLSDVVIQEHLLEDIMELTDTNAVKLKLSETELAYSKNSNELNTVRLGIIYHETALNLSFLSKTNYKGYAQKSYDILNTLLNTSTTTKALLPFIASYHASAIALVGAETKKLKLLSQSFTLFKEVITNYEAVSYLPEFLRGSVAENLPWYFYSKRKAAKYDFQSIIDKQAKDTNYANWKIMSFTYWAWANQHQSKRYRIQALQYLDKAIELDPNNKAGKQKAEELKRKWMP
jgi:hypothetical protein